MVFHHSSRYVVSAKDHSTLLQDGDQLDEEKYRRDEEKYDNLVLQLVVFASESNTKPT